MGLAESAPLSPQLVAPTTSHQIVPTSATRIIIERHSILIMRHNEYSVLDRDFILIFLMLKIVACTTEVSFALGASQVER